MQLKFCFLCIGVLFLFGLSLGSSSSIAFAQSDFMDAEEIEAKDSDESTGQNEPLGAGENPDAPQTIGAPEEIQPPEAVPTALLPKVYPIEQVHRPLTLPQAVTEIRIDVPLVLSPFSADFVINANYAVTDDWEAVLRYNAGAFFDSSYTAGKTLAIGARRAITHYVAAEASLSTFLDPFALGLHLAAPFRFVFSNKIRVDFGENLINIKIAEFAPNIYSTQGNEALGAVANIGSITPDGDFRLVGRIWYQWQPDLAVSGETGVIAPDFALSEGQMPLWVTAQYSASQDFDLGARFGTPSISDISDNLTLWLYLQTRL